MDEEPKVETPRTQIPRTAKDGEMSDFLSFKEVLSELGLGEDELNEIVSNGGLPMAPAAFTFVLVPARPR